VGIVLICGIVNRADKVYKATVAIEQSETFEGSIATLTYQKYWLGALSLCTTDAS
jgi:hypothetical protein